MEEWKDIVGYEGIYQVSSLGKVTSDYGEDFVKSIFTYKKIIKPQQKNKYKAVWLYKPKGRKECYIHRLVAKAFIPNPENKPCVNHIDGNKDNNRVENLEWCTYKENQHHAIRTGLHYKRILTNEDIINIRASKETSASLAAKYNYDSSGICKIRKNKIYNYAV